MLLFTVAALSQAAPSPTAVLCVFVAFVLSTKLCFLVHLPQRSLPLRFNAAPNYLHKTNNRVGTRASLWKECSNWKLKQHSQTTNWKLLQGSLQSCSRPTRFNATKMATCNLFSWFSSSAVRPSFFICTHLPLNQYYILHQSPLTIDSDKVTGLVKSPILFLK